MSFAHVESPLALYVHVPFCAKRCGYCDFNTYTADQLGGHTIDDYLAGIHAEIALAARVLGSREPAISVFVGGGTPSVLRSAQLAEILDDLRSTFGLAPDAEVTTEANPESVDEAWCEGLLEAGFNRLSLGMQSAESHVLATLDRVHTPGRALEVAQLARRVGFGQISLDLISGTPGESMDDWRASLDAALSIAPDHLSAYSLIVEDGTALARRIRKGLVPRPDDDEAADKYLLAESVLTAAGLENYEISNWSTGEQTRSVHNLAYWRSHDWWGFGPGAHSHLAGERWWNRKHPRDWVAALATGASPEHDRETLTPEERRHERVLLELRIADGLPIDVLTVTEHQRLAGFVADGLVSIADGRARLTLAGRLLADAVTRDLLD